MTITAPIGISSRPYRATNPSSCIATPGNIATKVVSSPVPIVTWKRETRGMTAWKASPAR